MSSLGLLEVLPTAYAPNSTLVPDAASAVSKLEQAEDVRVSTLRDYLEAVDARLELVAVFDDEDRRVPVHLAKEPAA